MQYLAICSRAPGNELIAAECEALTGTRPGLDGLAACNTVARVPQAAYLLFGMQVIASGDNIQALISGLTQQSYTSEGFSIKYYPYPERVSIHQREAIIAVADAIRGNPDLDHPQHRFLIVESVSGFYLGEILAQSDRSYEKHDRKPYRTSSSLPSQMARALVNLAYPARTIIDPCCGTGSILLEACATGVKAFGMDRNPRMVGMTRKNILHFGYEADVQRGDARQVSQPAYAVITDLPYGLTLDHEASNIQAILHQMARLAPLGIYIDDQDISAWLLEAGYHRVVVYRVCKRRDMIRYIHRAELA